MPWAVLASVSLHALAASWITPVGSPAAREMAPLQALLVVPPPRRREAETPPAIAPSALARAAEKPAPRARRSLAANPAPGSSAIALPPATGEPKTVLPAFEMAEAPPATAVAAPSPAGPTVIAAAQPIAAAAPVSPPSFHAAYLDNPKPAYPAAARRRGLQGETRLEVLVAANGLPQEVKVARSSGNDELDEAAQAAVKRWRFVPARRGEEKVDGWVEVPIAFRLER